MPILSDEQLGDLAHAYSCDQIIDLLDVEPITLLLALRSEVQDNIEKFNLLPVDAVYDF
jgi:hypothetical protein